MIPLLAPLLMSVQLWILTLAPTIAIGMLIYFFDKYEKEPLKMIVRAFFLGCLSVVPAYFLEKFAFHYLGSYDDYFKAAVASYTIIALSEEGSKYYFFRRFFYNHKELNEPYDAILYAVMISLGFATIENILYVMDGGSQVAVIRMFTAVPAHAAFAILFGYFAGLAKFSSTKESSFYRLLLGLLIAIFVHGTYDYLIFVGNNFWILIGALIHFILALYLAAKAVRLHSENSHFK